MRTTTTAPPATVQLNQELLLPIALTVTPFATPENNEMEVPLVDMLEYGHDTRNPIRCTRCMGYINPFVQWIENGKKWKCNLCVAVNVTPAWSVLSMLILSFSYLLPSPLDLSAGITRQLMEMPID
jgi:protein transport protein SEC24